MKYMIMVDHWFKCQDGEDSMSGEYSGIIHKSRAAAEKELREAFNKTRATMSDIPYIKVLEE